MGRALPPGRYLAGVRCFRWCRATWSLLSRLSHASFPGSLMRASHGSLEIGRRQRQGDGSIRGGCCGETGLYGLDALGWQATVLAALEAILLLRRPEEHSESDVEAAQQSLVTLNRWLDNGCAENDLEVAYVVSSQLAVFSPDREFAVQALCRVHCRVRAAGDIWLERRLLHALERCYLASDGQEKFARASLTIRNKKRDQCKQAIAEVVASAGHSAILSWTPRSAAQAASAAKTSQVLQP